MIDHRHYRAAIQSQYVAIKETVKVLQTKRKEEILSFLTNHKFKHWPSSNNFCAFVFSFSYGHFCRFQRCLIELIQSKWNNKIKRTHQSIQRIDQSHTFFNRIAISIIFWHRFLFDYIAKNHNSSQASFFFKSFLFRFVCHYFTPNRKKYWFAHV